MKSVKIMLVVVALLITVSAFSQGLSTIPMSARQLGMGGAAVAVADDAFAWTQNPAGLASLASKPKEGAKFSWDVAGSYGQSDEINGSRVKSWAIDFGACDPAAGLGFGAGWADTKLDPEKLDIYGAGFGMKLRSESVTGLSWGVNVQRAKYDNGDPYDSWSESKTLFNAGLLYEVPIAENKAIKLGLVCNDVTDELDSSIFGGGRSFSFGAALPLSDKILLAVDNSGVGSTSRTWGAGLEWRENEWAARIGDLDGSLSLGLGYKGSNWYADIAHANEFNAITAGVNF